MSVKNLTDFAQRLWFWLEVLLHAVNLRHGTHGFTSLLKEVILRIITFWKNPTTLAGFEPTNLGSSGEYDNYGTIRVAPHKAWLLFTCITMPKNSSILLKEDMLLTDANVCRELIIDVDICPTLMLGGISTNRYDRSLRFMVTCVAWFRKQAAQTSCRQNLVHSRVWHQRKRRTFVGFVHPHPLDCI